MKCGSRNNYLFKNETSSLIIEDKKANFLDNKCCKNRITYQPINPSILEFYYQIQINTSLYSLYFANWWCSFINTLFLSEQQQLFQSSLLITIVSISHDHNIVKMFATSIIVLPPAPEGRQDKEKVINSNNYLTYLGAWTSQIGP